MDSTRQCSQYQPHLAQTDRRTSQASSKMCCLEYNSIFVILLFYGTGIDVLFTEIHSIRISEYNKLISWKASDCLVCSDVIQSRQSINMNLMS